MKYRGLDAWPVVDFETATLTIVGAAIAGVIGLLATWYDRRLGAKARHLEEHRDNLFVVAKSLVDLRNRIWPPYRNMENFEIVEGFEPGVTTDLETFSMVERPVWMRVAPGEGGFEFVNVDRRLFNDMAVHFPELHRSLEELEDVVRRDGPNVLRPMYETFGEIYKAMQGRNMTPIYVPEEPNRDLNRRHLASATFNVLIGTKQDEWPSRYAQIVAQKALVDVEALAKELRSSIGKKVDDMVSLRDALIGRVDRCLDAIDEVRHIHHLKHRCPYL